MGKYAIYRRVSLQCQNCEGPFEAKRRDTKWCDPCRKVVKLKSGNLSRNARRPYVNALARAQTKRMTVEQKRRRLEGQQRRRLNKKYGITQEYYDKMLSDQNGSCAICRVLLVRPLVDHCHKTGKVRGLLCDSCNFGIGSFKDDIDVLERARQYLSRS